ncbi:hypothetical protein [Virgibacillus oceani]|uniref:Uncharacterized protein n=1 Tax=Virgibacillus oceani TaxID=1479511 RepID=A0A917H0K5_9BACI|nr:hypothetical protein [Virgibacillus oceani]GGG63676.1 hypothetical protein GCM10011398_03890 [Virgibacillus oceani]
MNKWTFICILISFIILAGFLYIGRLSSLPAITYFPIDQETTFEDSHTSIEFYSQQDNNSYDISWTSNSKSDKKVYLRQDASLLFDNGRLKGVLSKWRQNEDIIQLNQKLTNEDSGYFQAISFHHGEIHYPDDKIKSIHQMSYDELYVIDSPTTPLESFKEPKGEFENEWKNLLDLTTKQQLLYHWNRLMNYFDINKEDYISVPLTSLYKYNEENLPNMTLVQTDQIIGQLWEGLYKNYILPATSPSDNKLSSYIPIVLFDKKSTHLFVLYEVNGKKERLIQKY